jgi:hypothetical protein
MCIPVVGIYRLIEIHNEDELDNQLVLLTANSFADYYSIGV